MTLARAWVHTLRQLAAGGLPPGVAAHTRLHVADTVGVALAARRDAALLRRLRQALAGETLAPGQGSAVIGGGDALPAPAAAFVNVALAHALDFDDIHDEARLHPTPVTLAAALAVAGGAAAVPDSGARLLQAVAIGNETMCRLGRVCAPTGQGPASGWFLTQLLGTLGGALAAGWMLGLDDDGLVSALGFALMQAAGSKEPGFGTGTNARQIYPAFAAMAGVTAARLAAAGLKAPEGALDGAAGLWRLYLGLEPGAALHDALHDRARWDSLATEIKPWPCCRLSHPYVAAALLLREALAGRPVDRLVIGVNASAQRLCEPLAARLRPATLADAKYSVPFVTAATLVHGAPTLRLFDDTLLADPPLHEILARTEVRPGLPDRAGHPPARLQAWLRGSPLPIEAAADGVAAPDAAATRAKFLACTQWGGHADGPGLWDVLTTGGMPDIDTLMRRTTLHAPA